MAKAKPPKQPSAAVKRQAASKSRWNETRSAAGADFYTIGYSGRTADALVDTLEAHGVRTLVDVRQMPASMHRPDVSKTRLRDLVESRGLSYVHRPELGVPKAIRSKAAAGDREAIWRWYDRHVVRAYIDADPAAFLKSVASPMALMCVELDPHECHRHRLSLALERAGYRGFDL
jgi:uncharacterized protein (DUF488 family)